METREVVFSRTLAPGMGVFLSEPSPLHGKIVIAIRQWPNGSNNLVDLAWGRSSVWVMPNLVDTFTALNNATLPTDVWEPVYFGEQLWARFRNRDAVNPHTPSLTLIIEGEEQK